MKNKLGWLILGLAFGMSGCIDTGDSDDTDTDTGAGGGGGPATVERISFNGLVADGYLAGAKVCLDLNTNKKCDDGEPSTTSGTGGAFEITEATQEQRDTYPLLVEVVVGTTIDEDTITDDAPTGVAFDQPLTLTAPVGYEFISPLTTMVQNEVEGGATASAAETAVQEKLGTTLDLDSDYIAGQTGANSDEYEQLHQVAQVTAIVISDNLVKLEDAAQENNISLDDLISAIVDEVFAALEEITEQVEEIAQDDEQEFDPDSVATEVDEELVDLDPDTIDDVVDLNNAQDNAVDVSLASVIKAGGISWFYTELDDGEFKAEYGTLSIDGNDAFQDVSYGWNGSTFVEDTLANDSDSGYILLNGTWTATTNADEVSGINALEDGSIELVQAEGNFIKRFKGTEVDLANNNARILMNALDDGEGLWGEYLTADLVFPAGSKGYTLQDNGSDEPYIFESWNDCEVAQQVGGLCSFAYVQDGPGETGGPVATLAEITVATAAQVSGSASTALPVLKAVEIGYGDDDKLWAEIVAGGVVNYYVVAKDHQSYVSLGASTWAAVSGAQSTTIELQAIAGIHHFDSEFDDGGNPVLAVIGGFVRNASHELNTGEVSNVVQLLNDTARDAVVGAAAFSADNLALRFTAPCTDGNSTWDGDTAGAAIVAQWGLASDFDAAVISCLAGNPEDVYVESEMKDIVVKNLRNDVKVTYLAHNKGVISSAEGQIWFDWSINGDGRLVLNYVNPVNNGLETLTIAQLIKSSEQAYVQSKSFLENANVTAGLIASGLPSRGLISVNAFDVLPLDPADTVLPTIIFDESTLAGTYEGTPAEGDEGASYVLNANGTGSVHWDPDAEQLAEDEQHPGDDDDLQWSVDDQGRLLINLFNAQTGDFYGVDRYSIIIGDQSLGAIKGEEINSAGRYHDFGNFAWERTGDAPTAGFNAATVPGIYAWGITPDEGKGDLSITLMEGNIGTAHWPPEPDETNPDHPGYVEEITWTVDASGYLIVNEIVDDVDGPGHARYSVASGTQSSGTVQAESCAADMCEVTHTYTWEKEATSTLSDLVGVWDDHGYQGGTIEDMYFIEFTDNGDGTGTVINYDYQTDSDSTEDLDCSIINTIDITDNGDGTFHAVGFEDLSDGGAALDFDNIFWSRDGSTLHGFDGDRPLADNSTPNYNVACP